MLIDQLPELNSLDDADEVPVERGTSTYKAKITAFIGRFVKKTGDTMTGILTNTANFRRQNPNFELGDEPSQQTALGGYYIADKNNLSAAWVEATAKTDGSVFTRIAVRTRDGNGNNVNQFLDMTAKKDGTFAVNLNRDVWLSSLGLLDATKTTTVASIITAASNVTITGANYAQFGKVAQLRIIFKPTADIGSNVTIGTLVTGKRPVYWAMGTIRNIAGKTAYIQSGGAVVVSGGFTSGTEYEVLSTYILA